MTTIADEIRKLAAPFGAPPDERLYPIYSASCFGYNKGRDDAARIAEAGEAKLREESESLVMMVRDAVPDYPWNAKHPLPLREAVWALVQSMEGTSLACDDLHKELESLRAKLARAREVIEFYSDPDSYKPAIVQWAYGVDRKPILPKAVLSDQGATARAFLKETP